MFEATIKFFKELDQRFKVVVGAFAVNGWVRGLSIQYQQLYTTALGANPVELGTLNSIGSAVSAVVSAPMGWLVDKYGMKKIIALGLALSAAVAGIYGFAVNWWLLIPAIILAQIAMRGLNPLADAIFVATTKPEQRAMGMAVSRIIMGIPAIFAPTAAAVLVTHFGGINAQGIRPLYYLQLVCTIFVFLFIVWKLPAIVRRGKRGSEPPTARGVGFIQDFRDLFKGETGLKRWLVVSTIRTFGMRIAMPFVPLWMVGVKGANPYILGLMGSIGTVTGLLLQIPVGRLADKIGRKKGYLLLRPFVYLGTMVLIFAPRPEYLLAVGLLGAVGSMQGGGGGGIGGVSFVPLATMFWEMVPQEKAGRWFGMEGILINIISVPAAVIGGFLWQQGWFTEVLLIPILLEVCIQIPIFLTIPDTLNRATRSH